ncbi:MAG: pyridoxal phosphate-dependent aminotransferase [Chloroflexi bacterium]|nr:pyridoxal phosphate-dependent aminotransferase [Chloroflexota bacterium]
MSTAMSWEGRLAQRVWDVRGGKEDSPFLRLMALTKGVPNLISLGRGDPDLPTPPHIVQAAQRALAEGKTKYTVPPGLEELRVAVAGQLARESGLQYNPENEVIITSGTQEAVNVIFQALLNPGDEVLLPEPFYMAYYQAIRAVGGVAVTLTARLEDNFVVQPADLEAAITPRTKAMILVSPSNPTGTVIDRATTEAICQIALKHDLVVISDELYDKIVFDGARVTPVASLPGMWERTITVNGFSKTYSMTGLRVGYFAAPRPFADAALEVRHMMSICAPTPSQWAALAALEGPQDCVRETLAVYAERRQLMLDGLAQVGVPTNRPQGAFFVFADIRACGMSSFDFCAALLKEKQVLVFPGTQYGRGGEGFLRISYLAPLDQLAEAIRRFGEFYHQHGR